MFDMIDEFLPRDDPRWGWEFVVEDFVHARLLEDEARLEAMPAGHGRDAFADRIAALRVILLEHSIYIYSDGRNSGRCYTCDPVHGVPCVTMISLARLWAAHPDLPPAAQSPVAGIEVSALAAGTYRRRHRQRCDGVTD